MDKREPRAAGLRVGNLTAIFDSVLRQDRRRAEKDGLQARGHGSSRSLRASCSGVTGGSLVQPRRQRHHQQSRQEREGRQFGWASIHRLPNRGPFLLREELRFRSQMRDRIFPLIKRKLVLQTPPKNRHGQHQQPKREQESETALPRRIAKTPHDSNDAPKPPLVVTPPADSLAICLYKLGYTPRSVPATNRRVPHISLVFREMPRISCTLHWTRQRVRLSLRKGA
jgi:hypothetical protein